MSKIKTVLFDLDGTLIDTAPDMIASLDQLCNEENQSRLAYDFIRPHVSNGSIALVKLAFGAKLSTERLNTLKERYLNIYENKLSEQSTLFPGIEELLIYIETNKMKWGVVTNKPGWLTNPLMESLTLSKRAAGVISGESTNNRKPHPEPIYAVCKLIETKPSDCVYIGDSIRDIEAGINAGMKTIVANFGYIGDWEDVNTWNADLVINSPLEIIDWLKIQNN